MNHKIEIITLVLVAIGVSYVPFLYYPFGWFETYFHELSHGLMAILTGGSISEIIINYDTSGLCITMGGVRFAVAYAGYFGASFFGFLIVLLSLTSNKKVSYGLFGFISFILLLTAVLYARSVSTLVIIAIMEVILFLFMRFSGKLIEFSSKFIGVYILVNSIKSPLVLFYVDGKSDARTLSDLTMMPEFIWIISWFVISIFFLYKLFSLKIEKENVTV